MRQIPKPDQHEYPTRSRPTLESFRNNSGLIQDFSACSRERQRWLHGRHPEGGLRLYSHGGDSKCSGNARREGVAMTHFDGQGGLRQVDWVMSNGAPLMGPADPVRRFRIDENGTYRVHRGCTGSAVITFPANTRGGRNIFRLRCGTADHVLFLPQSRHRINSGRSPCGRIPSENRGD